MNQAIDNGTTDFAKYAVIFASMTGMRVAEIAALKWADIDYENGVIHVCKSDKLNRKSVHEGIDYSWRIGITKTKKNRYQLIHPALEALLRKIKETQDEKGIVSEFVFPDEKYRWKHSSMISSCIKNSCRCKRVKLSRTYGI